MTDPKYFRHFSPVSDREITAEPTPPPPAQRFEPVPVTQRSVREIPLEWDVTDEPPGATVRRLIAEECTFIRDLLHGKNIAYGNAIFEPVRVFSSATPEESIRIRLDDKLSRLIRGDDAGEDTELDLIGYLILLRVARRLGT